VLKKKVLLKLSSAPVPPVLLKELHTYLRELDLPYVLLTREKIKYALTNVVKKGRAKELLEELLNKYEGGEIDPELEFAARSRLCKVLTNLLRRSVEGAEEAYKCSGGGNDMETLHIILSSVDGLKPHTEYFDPRVGKFEEKEPFSWKVSNLEEALRQYEKWEEEGRTYLWYDLIKRNVRMKRRVREVETTLWS